MDEKVKHELELYLLLLELKLFNQFQSGWTPFQMGKCRKEKES